MYEWLHPGSSLKKSHCSSPLSQFGANTHKFTAHPNPASRINPTMPTKKPQREPYLSELPSPHLNTRSKPSRETSAKYYKPQDPPEALNKNGPLRLHFQHLDRLSALSTAQEARPSPPGLRPRLHRAHQPLVPRQPPSPAAAQARRDAYVGELPEIPHREERGSEGEEAV